MMNEVAYPSDALENHEDVTKVVVERFDYRRFGMQEKYQYLFKFDNGYTVSVITGFGAYGNVDAPYELGLMESDGSMVSLEGVTDEGEPISGYNTEEEILDKLKKVKSLGVK